MPRTARKRDPEATHHIICRCISEISLFRCQRDKFKYLSLMGTYCEKFNCSILSYCLMDTHIHIQFDPQGCDISKFMHGLNLSYAMYYNMKYNRRGPVFCGRFKNFVINDDVYNLAVSGYIHKNPKDIPDYRDSIHSYYFSSYGVYLGFRAKPFNMLNTNFILSQFAKNPKEARSLYAEFVNECNESANKEKVYDLIDDFVSKEAYEYKNYRHIYLRNLDSEKVIKTIAEALNIPNPGMVHIKYSHRICEFRSLCVFFMRCLCDYSYKKICKVIGNITLSQVYKLCNKGYTLMISTAKYKNLFSNLLEDLCIA